MTYSIIRACEEGHVRGRGRKKEEKEGGRTGNQENGKATKERGKPRMKSKEAVK